MFYNTPCSKADNEKKIQKSTKPSVYFSFAFESSLIQIKIIIIISL
jgi:hypothetical protein